MSFVRRNGLGWVVVGCLGWVGVLAGVDVGAQEDDPDKERSAERGDLKVDDEEVSVPDVPDNEKPAEAEAFLSEMKGSLRTVLRFLEEARDERDVVKLNCVNEKLTALKGLLRVSEAADLALREALARRDREAANHEFEKIAVASNRVGRFRVEAQQCVGELAVYAGDTQVNLVITNGASAIPDPSAPPPGISQVTRPPAVSPSSL